MIDKFDIDNILRESGMIPLNIDQELSGTDIVYFEMDLPMTLYDGLPKTAQTYKSESKEQMIAGLKNKFVGIYKISEMKLENEDIHYLIRYVQVHPKDEIKELTEKIKESHKDAILNLKHEDPLVRRLCQKILHQQNIQI